MGSIRATAALVLSLLPNQLSACEVAIRDAKGAVAAISTIFASDREGCRYEDAGVRCSVTERSFLLSLSAAPGFVPGYFAIIVGSARERVDKDALATIFTNHLFDRSPNKGLKERLLRAFEGPEELKLSNDGCVAAVRMKDGVLDIVVAGPMVR